MIEVLNAFLGATTTPAVIEAIEALGSKGQKITWRPVGGNENNLAIIGLGSDPGAGLIERITNALDAVIEREWEERGKPEDVANPRQASEVWFKVPRGRLSEIAGDELRNWESVSDRVRVTLRDGDQSENPTVDIRDNGIGITADDFSRSILSLNQSRKLHKLFLAGAFGQGGSTALINSPFTVIFSRKYQTNEVAFTVVRYNDGDPERDKHGVFEYMINSKTGAPFSATVPDDFDFAEGTLVRHVSMQISKFSKVMTAPTGSLWWLVHNYLFDPVLPFKIEDSRSGKKEAVRTATGNNRLLTRTENLEYSQSANLTFGNGAVTITWWVLKPDEESNRITQYAQVSKPIIVTVNGQKQGDYPNTLIKDELKLPYLDRHIVVHVDCDRLDGGTRRQLFPTTRETIRDTRVGEDLRNLVVETLAADANLKRLDAERKQRYLRKSDDEALEAVARRLANRVETVTTAGTTGQTPAATPGEPHEPGSAPIPIPVADPPTFLKITSANPRKVYAGKTFTIKFETDARPDLFDSITHFLAVISPPSVAQYQGATQVKNGYGTAYFKATEDLAVGTTAQITLELRPPRSTTLSDSVGIEIVQPPSLSGGQGTDSQRPNVHPQWVVEGDPFWVDNKWDKSSVAAVLQEEDGIQIYVSASNERLNRLIARAQRRSTDSVERLKIFYLEHMSFFAVLDHLRSNSRSAASAVEEDDDDPQTDEQLTLKVGNETICGLIEELFDLIIT